MQRAVRLAKQEDGKTVSESQHLCKPMRTDIHGDSTDNAADERFELLCQSGVPVFAGFRLFANFHERCLCPWINRRPDRRGEL